MLDKARETGHELVLIDTPPTIDRTTILVAAKADLIIVPTRTSILDLQALDDTLTILKATQGVNRIVVVINAAGPDAKARDAIKKLVRKEHGIPLLGAALEDHLEFRTSLGSGKGVTEAAAQSPAGKELKKLYAALSRWDAAARQEPQGGGRMRKRKPAAKSAAMSATRRREELEAVSGVERKKPAIAGRAARKGPRRAQGRGGLSRSDRQGRMLAELAHEHRKSLQDLGVEAFNHLFRAYGQKPIA